MWHRHQVYLEGKSFLKIRLPNDVCFSMVVWPLGFMNTYESLAQHVFQKYWFSVLSSALCKAVLIKDHFIPSPLSDLRLWTYILDSFLCLSNKTKQNKSISTQKKYAMNSFTQSPPLLSYAQCHPSHRRSKNTWKAGEGPSLFWVDWIPSQPPLASAALGPGSPAGFQVPIMVSVHTWNIYRLLQGTALCPLKILHFKNLKCALLEISHCPASLKFLHFLVDVMYLLLTVVSFPEKFP